MGKGIDEADYAAIWPATGFYLDSAGVATEVPVLLDSPWDFANSDTSALDIYGSLVLFQYTMSVSPAIPCCYAVYDLATNTWSAPMTSDASWTHTPQLTNASGWSVEYGTNYYGHENAFLVSTQPELISEPCAQPALSHYCFSDFWPTGDSGGRCTLKSARKPGVSWILRFFPPKNG